jgi:hypothetical protein
MKLQLRPEVTRDDLPALPDEYRREAVRILLALDRDAAEPEGYEVVTLTASRVALDLTGCYSVRFGGEAYDDGYRLVFQLLDGGAVEVVAVGSRQASLVFRTAQDRLRPPARRHRLRTHSAKDWS